MVSLKVQKRLSAKVLKCGKGRIWMDPNEATEIGLAKSRRSVKKLAKDGYIVKKQTVTHSRSKARAWDAAKRLGKYSNKTNYWHWDKKSINMTIFRYADE